MDVEPHIGTLNEGSLHAALKASYAETIGDSQLAVIEYEVLLKLEINDPAEAQTNLAQAYLNNGQVLQAKKNILRALETAPSYQRAQRILLQSIDGDSD